MCKIADGIKVVNELTLREGDDIGQLGSPESSWVRGMSPWCHVGMTCLALNIEGDREPNEGRKRDAPKSLWRESPCCPSFSPVRCMLDFQPPNCKVINELLKATTLVLNCCSSSRKHIQNENLSPQTLVSLTPSSSLPQPWPHCCSSSTGHAKPSAVLAPVHFQCPQPEARFESQTISIGDDWWHGAWD